MKRIVVASIALAVAGCASTPMVRSVDRTKSNTTPAVGSAAYLGEYALPRSRFTVTITAPSAASPPATAAPTVTNTVTVNTSTPAAAAAAAKPPAADLATWCRTQRDAYNQRKRTIAEADARLQAYKQSAAQAFADGSAMSAAEKTDWKARLEAHIPVMIAADTARVENQAAALLIQPHCPQPIRVAITETIERDPTRILALYADHDDEASDRLSLTLDVNGFITGLSGTSSDRSGEALVGATKTLAAVTTFMNPFDASKLLVLDGPEKTFDDCSTSGSAIARSERLRRSLRTTGAINQAVVLCGLELLKVPNDSPEFDLTLPLEFSWVVPTPKADEMTATKVLDFTTIPELNLTGSITCATGRASRADENAIGEGLVWSTPVPCELTVSRDNREIARANTWSLDSSRTTVLEVPRTALVAQTAGYTFVNGRQTGANWDRPSPTEQLVTLPVRMIGAVVEGVTAGASGERGRTEAQTAQIEAETARLEALTALEAARAAREEDEDED